jgi:hypothetical protein
MKNEGALLAISVSCGLASVSLLSRHRLIHLRHFFRTLRFLPLAALPLCNFLFWSWRRNSWGFENDLAMGMGSFSKILERIAEGKMTVIGRYLLIDANVCRAMLLLLCGLFLGKLLRVRTSAAFWFAVLSAFIYFAGIFIVYLATPAELTWHLNTSATRTMQTVVLGIFVASYFTLSGLEGGELDANCTYVGHKLGA